jgi:transcriptional regulator with XRE-family HTH domain
VSQALISRYERGAVQPSLETLQRLANAVGAIITIDVDGQRMIDTTRFPTEEEAAWIEAGTRKAYGNRRPFSTSRFGGVVLTDRKAFPEVWAAAQAQRILEPLGWRWLHTGAVAQKARGIAKHLHREDARDLVAAAYLHDIGYAAELRRTGFHPLDGARFIRAAGGMERVANLVAYHSAAQFEAEARGLLEELAEFQREDSPIADALTYCDVTTSPSGRSVSLRQRAEEVVRRYGKAHDVSKSVTAAMPMLLGAVSRTEARLAAGSFEGSGDRRAGTVGEVVIDAKSDRGVDVKSR